MIDPSQATVTVTAAYDGYGEVAKTTSTLGSQSFDTYSAYTYTADGQLATRQDNGKEGSTTAAPARVSLVYDGADWLTGQYDFGAGTTCAGDQHVTTSYLPTGWQSRRVMARMAGSCSGAETTTASSYPTKQTSEWTYNDNGKLHTLDVLDAAGHVLQASLVGYDDPAGVYNDGFATSDQFSLNGPGSTQCTGPAPACTASYVYDARDKLIASNDGHGTQTSYTLDGAPSGCVTADPAIRAGNVTTEAKNTGATISRCYTGNQQSTQIDPSGTTKYWYDDLGRLLCVTTTAVTSRDECRHSDAAAADTNLRQVNTYDYLDHLILTRRYNSSGAKTDSASYIYDALDRIAKEKETHTTGSVTSRTTTFSYLALTKQAVNDHQATTANCSGTPASLTADKSYLYGGYGQRLAMADRSATCAATTQPASPTMYDYSEDTHGSVATLNRDGNTSGAASAVYSYTPYGQEDDQADQGRSLSKGDVLQSASAVNGTTRNDNPLNPFRYSAKRYDTGSQTLDTGARRFDLGSGRFLQPDLFRGALDDLDLATDPLNQNRYALAAANPIGYAESDGHTICDAGICPTQQQTTQVTKAAAAYGAGCPSSIPGCPGYINAPTKGQLAYMRHSLGYQGPARPTPGDLVSWLAQASQSNTNPNGAWDFFCQGLLRASTSQCAANPFNGDTNIYDTGTSPSDLWKELRASPKLAMMMITVEAPAFGAPELGAGDLAAGAIDTVAAEDAGAAAIAANASRLAAQLTRQEASSIFTPEGTLQPEVIANSREIINGTQLGNKQLVSQLTSNGSDLADWGKYTTQTFRSPSGPFQVHFYYNSVTGEPFYGLDYKAVFVGGSP